MTAVLSRLAPIELEEVLATADLQSRRDRKYLVPADAADAVLADLDARVLEIDGLRRFRYESVYFDTPDWASYLGAARHRPQRFKVRTRTYCDRGDCLLEVKVRDRRGHTVKHRYPYDPWTRDRLTEHGVALAGRVEVVAPYVDELHPSLTVHFDRSTLVLDDRSARITIDDAVTWSVDGAHPARLHGPRLVETKTAGPPCALDRALWRAGHRPVAISKYCTGIALFWRDVPANRWHRVLRRDILPQVIR